MQTVLLLGLAGGLGSLARYGLSALVGALFGGLFPWGIFLVNVLGCFLFGVVWGIAAVHHLLSDTARLIILTGFMGSFTTFSTFIFDSHVMLESGKILPLCLNLAGQLILGLLAVHAGIRLTGLA